MSETIETPVIDKSTWGPGAWQDEPDRVDWIAHGFACFGRRNHHGAWCGYAGVPREHPAYGKDHDDVDVEVHGGLTYSANCDGEICHVPAPGMPDDVWWLGFDCAHFNDLVPGMEARMREIHVQMGSPVDGPFRALKLGEVYRDLPYVRRQTTRLAKQLAAMA